MNKRIKQLAYAAKLDEHMLWTSHEGNVLPDEMIKFAELIVKECAESLWTEECYNSDLALEEFEKNSKKIKEHFGIQEVLTLSGKFHHYSNTDNPVDFPVEYCPTCGEEWSGTSCGIDDCGWIKQ